MFRSGSRRVGSGEEGIAEGAFEFDGFGEAGVGVRDENGLEVGPVPGAFALDGLCADSEEALEALVDGTDGGGGVVGGGEGVGGGGGGGGHCLELEG